LIYIYRVIFLLLSVGIPNYFVDFDVENLNSAGLNIVVYIRLFVFLTAILFLSVEIIRTNRFSFRVGKLFLLPLLLYTYYFIITVFMQQGRDLYVSLYRIVEYLIFLIFLYQYIYRFRYLGSKYIVETQVAWVLIYTLIIVIVGLVFFPDKMITVLSNGSLRLGGMAMHPNTLGNLAVVGFLYYFFLGIGFKRKVLSLTWLIILAFTLSRGAYFAFIVSMFYWAALKSNYKFVFRLIALPIIIFSTILIVPNLINFLSRGQGMDGLISLSGRLPVWLISIDVISSNVQNFVFGISFGQASDIIGDLMVSEYGITYWKSQNAHNDLLQAMLGGGIFAVSITMYVYVSMFVKVSNIWGSGVAGFYVGLAIVLILFSISMTTINFNLSVFSALIWMLFVFQRKEGVV